MEKQKHHLGTNRKAFQFLSSALLSLLVNCAEWQELVSVHVQ